MGDESNCDSEVASLLSLGIDFNAAAAPPKESEPTPVWPKAQAKKRGRKPDALKRKFQGVDDDEDAASTAAPSSCGTRGNRVGEKRKKASERGSRDPIICPICLTETTEHYDKGIFCYDCTKDVNCMDKAVPKKTQKTYREMKKNKDGFYELVRIWKAEVGPSLGQGKPRGGHFDWLQWEVVWEKKMEQKQGKRGQLLTKFQIGRAHV